MHAPCPWRLIAISLCLSGLAHAAGPAPLERGEIVRLYMDGKFDTLAAVLEKVRWEKRMHNRDDSVFVFKFLGAIYGEEQATRKKAESFLYGMLKLNPLENLGGLGASDSVEALFKKVRTVYAILQRQRRDAEAPRPLRLPQDSTRAPGGAFLNTTPALVVTEEELPASDPAK